MTLAASRKYPFAGTAMPACRGQLGWHCYTDHTTERSYFIVEKFNHTITMKYSINIKEKPGFTLLGNFNYVG